MRTSQYHNLELELIFSKLRVMRDELASTTDLGTHLTDQGFEYERKKMHRKIGALMDLLTYDVLPRISKDKITVD